MQVALNKEEGGRGGYEKTRKFSGPGSGFAYGEVTYYCFSFWRLRDPPLQQVLWSKSRSSCHL